MLDPPLDPLLPLLSEPPLLPLPLSLGPLLLGGDVLSPGGLLSVLGGLLLFGVFVGGFDVDGGFGLLFDVLGQVALASITESSGHVLVVGDGVNVCVADAHDGSVGFLVQSTGGRVDVVQLLTHVDLAPNPPDAEVFVLFVGRHVALWFAELHEAG